MGLLGSLMGPEPIPLFEVSWCSWYNLLQ